MLRRSWVLTALCTIAVLCWIPAQAVASSPVPRGFVGVSVGSPLYPNPVSTNDLDNQLDLMVASGVETLRIGIDWAGIQPYKNWRKVPHAQHDQFVNVGGVPTNFASIDQIVGPAAQRGLTIMPLVHMRGSSRRWYAGTARAEASGTTIRRASRSVTGRSGMSRTSFHSGPFSPTTRVTWRCCERLAARSRASIRAPRSCSRACQT